MSYLFFVGFTEIIAYGVLDGVIEKCVASPKTQAMEELCTLTEENVLVQRRTY